MIDADSDMPLPAASIDGFVTAAPAKPIFTLTASATGAFSHAQATDGTPLAGFLVGSAAGYVDTYYYPAVPIVADLDVEMELFTPETLGAVVATAAPRTTAAPRPRWSSSPIATKPDRGRDDRHRSRRAGRVLQRRQAGDDRDRDRRERDRDHPEPSAGDGDDPRDGRQHDAAQP